MTADTTKDCIVLKPKTFITEIEGAVLPPQKEPAPVRWKRHRRERRVHKGGWQQDDFKWFQKGLTQERRDRDSARLKEFFNLAADVPTFKQALDWAEKHGVQFFIDRTCTKDIGGYYNQGTGVVGIAAAYAEPGNEAYAVQALTHEIRHAWQDYYGLLRRPAKGFASFFIQTALVEADAKAFDQRALAEFCRARLKNENDIVAQTARNVVQGNLSDEEESLREGFRRWFIENTKFYGNSSSKIYGHFLGLAHVTPPDRKYEFKPSPFMLSRGSGIDLQNLEDIGKLGKTFSGKNYLVRGMKDTFIKEILSPSLAMSFYKAANDDQRKLVANIRKAELRQKHFVRQTLKSLK